MLLELKIYKPNEAKKAEYDGLHCISWLKCDIVRVNPAAIKAIYVYKEVHFVELSGEFGLLPCEPIDVDLVSPENDE